MNTNTNQMNRLANIATRQRGSRVRDAVFTACVALAAVVSLTSVGKVAHDTAPISIAQR